MSGPQVPHLGELVRDALGNFGENVTNNDQLLKRVQSVCNTLDEIERIVRPPNKHEHLTREKILKSVQSLSEDRNGRLRDLHAIGKEVSRVTYQELTLQQILPQTKLVVDALEDIKSSVQPIDLDSTPADPLEQKINFVRHHYEAYLLSKHFLTRLVHVTHPLEPASRDTKDSTANSAALATNQDPGFHTQRANPRFGLIQSNEQRSTSYKSAQLWREGVNGLQSELQACTERNQALEIHVKRIEDALQNALLEIDEHKHALTLERSEKLVRFESGLTNSHAESVNKLEAKIESVILGIEQKYDRKFKDISARIADDLGQIRETYHSKAQKCQEDLNDHKNAYKKFKKETETQHQHQKQSLLKQIRDLTSRLDSIVGQCIEGLVEQKKIYENLKEETETYQQHQKEEFLRQIGILTAKHDARVKEFEENLTSQENIHKNFKEEVEIQHRLQKEGFEIQLNSTLAEERSKSQAKFSASEEKHARSQTEQQQLHTEKLEGLAKTHEMEKFALEEALDREQKTAAERLSEAAEKYKAEIVELVASRDQLQDLFFKKDSFSGLTDPEIVRGSASKGGKPASIGFTDLVNQVAAFADWQWREDRKIWPQAFLSSLVGTKQRRLKKLILTDMIWCTLFQLIFASPFRILGNEGTSLEQDWIRQFPSAEQASSTTVYLWPPPSVACEKYRWETCEAALNSLTKPSSPYGSLRFSYVQNQAEFKEHFLKAVEAFVVLNEKKEQDLLKFLTEAVGMWLSFGCQRYRLRMILPGSNVAEPEKKMKLLQEQADLPFVSAPRLQRHGNMKGMQLDQVCVISGCNGKTATVEDCRV